MRKSISWSFGVTAILSCIALAWPIDKDSTSATSPTQRDEHDVSVGRRPDPPIQSSSVGALPTTWPASFLEAAKRDLFESVSPPASPTKPATETRTAPPPLLEPAEPPPPLSYRYLGQMRSPDGSVFIYLSRGKLPVQVSVGQQMEDGYVVDSISTRAVHLTHSALGTKALVNIPLEGQ